MANTRKPIEWEGEHLHALLDDMDRDEAIYDESGPTYPREPWRDVANDSIRPEVTLGDKIVFGLAVLAMVTLIIWLGQP